VGPETQPDGSTDIEATLRAMEQRRLAALVAGDIDVAEALHADDYELVTPSGATYSKREYLDAIKSGEVPYQVFEAAASPCIRVRGDTAILRYQARISFDTAIAADTDIYWHTDYWERRDGRWQAVWSQATQIVRREAPSR
jgi:hypothetical protein